jgi:hypothetical protein
MERDEWLRAAWRVPSPERYTHAAWCTGTRQAPTFPFLCSTPGPRRDREGLLLSTVQPRRDTTLLASMIVERMKPSLAVTGAVDDEVFKAYLERILLLKLRQR